MNYTDGERFRVKNKNNYIAMLSVNTVRDNMLTCTFANIHEI